MIRSDRKVRELSEILNRNNSIAISEKIESLRDEQPFEGAIGLLIALYDKSADYSIRRLIEGFMNDLKDQTVCQEVINEIKKHWKSETINMLVSSCWQSGLNYADYTLDMAKLFVRCDYLTAVECLTVIEESAHKLKKEDKGQIIKILEESPSSSDSEKNSLTKELISILI